MKAHLMYRERDLDLEQPLPVNAEALKQDLELTTLFDAMARGDAYLRELVEKAFLSSLTDPKEIRYRQAVLGDCLERPAVVRELYALAVEALDSKRKAQHLWFRDSPETLLRKSLRILELLADVLERLRKVADEQTPEFWSDGFTKLFAMLQRDLDDDYLRTIDHHMRELEFRRGALISAGLGRGNRGTNYVLRRPHERSLFERITPGGPRSYSFTIPARDEHGMQSLDELRGRGINLVANALAQSTDHILSFFNMLRAELGFYVGCLNLHEQLAEKGEPTCFPVPLIAEDEVAFSASGLYDAALTFHLGSQVVGNDVDADGKQLVMITGANEGGKSTFLRSVGLAQLMMQAGMFVPAESFQANVCAGVFTHFKREEDASMTSGKLDEELSRVSEIADTITPTGLLLCNESFASTNEREGSEIARQVVRAMVEAKVKVVFVTHLFDLANGFYQEQLATALFLRAERREDGTRTFRVLPNEPLPTSYGEDSYRRIFALARQSPDVRGEPAEDVDQSPRASH
jgi:DNA mismatch repair ATPase MutS